MGHISSDDDDGDDMPFAWGQSEQNVSMGIAQGRSIAELCAAPPTLISFSEFRYAPGLNKGSSVDNKKSLVSLNPISKQ